MHCSTSQFHIKQLQKLKQYNQRIVMSLLRDCEEAWSWEEERKKEKDRCNCCEKNNNKIRLQMVPVDEQKKPMIQPMPRCCNWRPGRTGEKRRGKEPARCKTQASHVRWEQKEVRTNFKKKDSIYGLPIWRGHYDSYSTTSGARPTVTSFSASPR